MGRIGHEFERGGHAPSAQTRLDARLDLLLVKLFLEGGEVAIVEAKVLRLLDADETNGECKAALKFTSISLEDADSLRGFLLR